MAGCDLTGGNQRGSGRSEREQAFIRSFPEEDQAYACELIRLARKSYQLRDDDNLYLGQVEKMLMLALHEAARRLGTRYDSHKNSLNPEELLSALRLPGYILPQKAATEIHEDRKTVNARQLRGQPAGKGIARGRARVISSPQDIVSLERDEILVCDAIDPTMTFCIPLVSAIVERRGGMLIHGAIIAREYGIPCVTGIPQATEFLRTGDDITVDGFIGLVINHTRTEGGGRSRSVSCGM
jgi:pyruvate,water dikinase